MHIAIDARPASHPQPGGFKRYTEQLLTALAQTDTRNQYHIYFDRAPARDFFAGNPNFKISILPIRVPALGVLWREQITVARAAKRNGASVIHFPANASARFAACPTVVTMHDIIFLDEKPELKNLALAEKIKRYGMYRYGRWSAQAAIHQAQRLITVSEYSKQKICERYGIAGERCAVVYSGVTQTFRVLPETERQAVQTKLALPKPFLLGIVSASPRKNAIGLLNAYAAMDATLQEKYDLVLVWTHGLWQEQLQTRVRDYGLDARVRFIQNVSDEDLVGLMNRAAAFVFPSIEEGFGLPPLEAMACGAPVIASNRSCIPEILGDAARLVNPTDPVALAREIEVLLTQPDLAQEYRARGLKHAARFSWQRCAKQTIQVYQEASRAH